MYRNEILWGLMGLLLSACSSFQRAPYTTLPESQGYNGMGRYKTGEDYGSSTSLEFVGPNGYQPQHPFFLKWPVQKAVLSRGFRSFPPHHGLDLAGDLGDTIVSAHEGFVVYVGSSYSGYGRMIIVEYDKSWATLYAHLHRVIVQEGQIVQSGQPIGYMGQTGRATGVHLHFELLLQKKPVDPLPYLKRSLAQNSP